MTDYTGHVAIYKQSQWFPVPWKGFNGPVYSIIKHQQQQSILFAGQFDSTGDGQFFNENTAQTINLLSSATISAGNSANFGDNTNPASVVCSQSPWLLQDGIPGYWEAQFNSPVQPSVFRLSNAHLDGRNTNEFNIISLGSNQYFQLSYTDPTTGQLISCTDKCILSNDPTIAYQDFTVTTPITTTGIRINIDSWFGSSGGLSNVQIFRSDLSLQPQPINDNPSTISCSNTPSSTASTTGTWSQVFSYQTYRNFLIATFPATELQSNNVSVTYQPYISGQGMYNVYATTPGCVGTSTCDQRTQVILDISLNPGTTTTYALDQQNAADQRTLIYTGPITASSTAFQPTIQMRVSPTARVPSSGLVSIAADSLEFIRNNTGTVLSSILNYYPLNNTWLPLPQQLPPSSTVHSLQSHFNRIYIGGNFKSNTTYAHLVSFDFDASALIPVQNTGLNGPVSTLLLLNNSQLIVGGSFNNTETPLENTQLNHVAIYNLDTNTFSPMNDGLDGPVKYLYHSLLDTTTNVHLSGSFHLVNGSNVYMNAQWDLSKNQWVPSSSFLLGPIATQLALGNGQALYLGEIQAAQTYRANTMASLVQDQWSSSISSIDPNATVTTGVFWQNTIILGGSFTLNNVHYLIAMYDGTTWSGLFDTVQGEIHTLLVMQEDVLAIGGQFKGTLGTIPITSFALYNLRQQRLEQVQGILRNDGSPGQVNIIRSRPDGKSILVAGDFAFAGLLNCNSICALGSDSRQWRQLGDNIQGNIKDMSIYQDSITVVGDLQVAQTPTGLAVLEDFNADAWRASSQDILSTNSLVNDGRGQFIVSGRSENQFYLGSWNGKELNKIDTNLGPSTEIIQLMYLPIQSSPSNARYPADSDTLLMAVGHLDLPDFGTASAALYDGSTWYPYLVTSTSNGTSGSIHTMFTLSECCTPKSVRRYLSVPAVILISIAISLAILFFLIALAFIYLFFKRRNNIKYEPAPMQEWKPKHRPSSLLAMLDAAQLTDSAFLSTTSAAAAAATAAAGSSSKQNHLAYSSAVDGGGRRGPSVDISDTARLRNSSGMSAAGASIPFSALLAAALKSNETTMASDASPKVYYAKFPFEAREFGELAFNAQTPIVVTDTSDDVWWMGYKDDGSGNPISGLFPSNYVSKAKPF
ncbi:cortical protein marker for cell polarity-domain-containing protein [Pilaira anomala]|nr:cortical protein marker for cell polarity-domain-containing protein [Pilaira anomala]